MLKRTAKRILSILLGLLFLSGCQDSLDIEDRDICTAVVVDKDEDRYTFYVEIAEISSKIQRPESGKEGGQQMSTSVVKGSGSTYAEARASFDKELNKPVYLGAVQSLILTERLADSDIEEYTLRLRQMTEYRKTMDVIVTPDDPEEFLKVHPENESTIGFAIEDTLENLNKIGMTYHISLADLLQKLQSKNPCYLMNTLSVREGQIVLVGNAVFDKGKRVGYIPFEESRGITYIMARLRIKPKFNYVVSLDGARFTLETTLKKRSIDAYYDGEKTIFDVTMTFDAQGLYPSERTKITDETRREMAEKLREHLQSDIRGTIETSQKKYECDYLSFSEPFRISYPEAFENLDWHEAFKKAEFRVSITAKLIPNRIVDYNPEPVI